MYCRSFRVPTKAGMCLLLRNIFRKSERRYYCIFRHRNVNQRRESWLSIADEIIKHHVITTEYGIYELSVSLSKVPDRKFFCRREQWIKRQGRGGGGEDRFYRRNIGSTRQRFSSYTHFYVNVYARGSTDTHTLNLDDMKTEEERVQPMISILSRRSWDLYLCLRVKREKIECRERDSSGTRRKRANESDPS